MLINNLLEENGRLKELFEKILFIIINICIYRVFCWELKLLLFEIRIFYGL